MRQGRVYCNNTAAGVITEDENGYSFVYDKEYLNTPDVQPVSLTLPLREEPYVNKIQLFFSHIYYVLLEKVSFFFEIFPA